MQIPKKLIQRWTTLRSHGDAAKIIAMASEKGIEYSDETVNRALRTGKCNDDLFPIIARFYNSKFKTVKKQIDDAWAI